MPEPPCKPGTISLSVVVTRRSGGSCHFTVLWQYLTAPAGVWFAVSQVVALACGRGPVSLATSGPVDLRAFDKMLKALHPVSSANLQPGPARS
jgi:hypothetical protein